VSPGGGIPTGTVTFKEGSTTLGTATLDASGVATFTTTSLGLGTHSITATYTTTSNYNSSSATVSQTIVLPHVASTVIDNGTGQQSMVRSVTLNFDTSVSPSALPTLLSQSMLTRLTNNTTVNLSGSLNSSGTALTLKFSGSNTLATSLIDGRYTLKFGG